MRKLLLVLCVALIAFWLGTLTANVFLVEQEIISVPIVEDACVLELVKESEKIESAVFGGQNIPLFEISQLSQPEEIEETEKVEFVDPEIIHAWYSPDNSKEMSELGMINFYGSDVDDNGIKLNEMVYETGIYTSLFKDDVSEGFAKGIETKVEGNKLKFKTKKLKGIEYRFEGTFFKNKMSGEQNEEILRGTLQKYIKGKKVAEVSGNFLYGEPYCLH